MDRKTNIVLIGFMGSGKTTIGTNLAYKLKYSFVDSDDKIVQKMNMSINKIFEIYGEDYFRNLEYDIVRNISKLNKQIISTGGGIIKNKNNIYELKKNGIILYLKASPEHIYSNIKDDTNRPLLQCDNKMEAIKALLNQREFLYKEYCDIIVDVSNNTVDSIVDNIINSIGGKYF